MSDKKEKPAKPEKRFEILLNEYKSGSKIILDKKTGVQYLFHQSGCGGGMNVLLGPEGKPLLYDSTVVNSEFFEIK